MERRKIKERIVIIQWCTRNFLLNPRDKEILHYLFINLFRMKKLRERGLDDEREFCIGIFFFFESTQYQIRDKLIKTNKNAVYLFLLLR